MFDSINKDMSNKIGVWALKYKLVQELGGKCTKCGQDKMWVLQFHHRDPKEKECPVSKESRYSEIIEEAKKCTLLCANCHAEHHYSGASSKYKIMKLKLLEVAGDDKCVRCGYNACVAGLDFHHTNPGEKSFNISRFMSAVRNHKSIPIKLKEEVLKCTVLCRNCHVTEHTNVNYIIENMDIIIEKSNNLKEVNSKLDEDAVHKMYNNGKTIVEIAELMDVSKSTIGGITRRLGLGMSAHEKTIDREKVLAMHSEGLTSAQIAKAVGCNRKYLPIVLSGMGLRPNKNVSRKTKLTLSAEQASKDMEGMSLRDMAKKYGVSHIAIRKRLIKYGIIDSLKYKIKQTCQESDLGPGD